MDPTGRAAGAVRGPKVGLVLGAGGITGIAWLAGAVAAIRERTGWDPATADVICGTSAGAVVAAVLAGGRDPRDLLVYAERPESLRDAVARATAGRPRDGFGLPRPGSLGLALRGVATTDPRRRAASLSGLVPRGLRSGDEIRGLVHDAAADGWPADRQLWLHAWDMHEGRLVTFGRRDAPAANVADAVVASCAVPAYYRPVRIGDRTYMDGGVRSLTNADRLLAERCDSVVIVTPFSSTHRGHWVDTTLLGAARRATAAWTAREADRLRRAGTEVAVVHPAADDIRAMGLNPMDRARSRHVLETAEASVGARAGALLRGLALHPRPRVVAPGRLAA